MAGGGSRVIIRSSDEVWKMVVGRHIEARSVNEAEFMGEWLAVSGAYEHFRSHVLLWRGTRFG